MLNELPASEVDNLCNILQKEWPQSIQVINLLRTCSEWKKKKQSVDTSIFYNEKNIQSGIFMSVNKSGCVVPLVTMYALDSYENELEEIFSNFLDNCNEIVTLSLISEKHVSMMEKVIATKGYSIFFSIKLVMYSMDINEAKNLEINYPSDVEVKLLKKEHLKEIYETWVMKDIHTMEELENCLELNSESAWGIFCKRTGRNLSRCMRSHDGSISALQTVEEARGKGYAKLLLKHVSKILAESSIVPYVYSADFNEQSIKAILGAGFHLVTRTTSMDIGKNKPGKT